MRNQTAFTLIELTLVIIILGILSVYAVSRFANLQDQAQLKTIEYIASAFESSVKLVKTVFNQQGHRTRVQNLEGFGDNNVDTNNIGYPIGTTKGNGNENIGVGNQGCVDLWFGLLQDPPSVALNNSADYRAFRHTSNRFCSYAYRKNGDTANRTNSLIIIRYNSNTGSVDICGRRTDIPDC